MTSPLTVYRGTETLRRGWTTGSCAAAASQAAASAEAAAERSNGRKLWDGLFSTAVGESPSPFYALPTKTVPND